MPFIHKMIFFPIFCFTLVSCLDFTSNPRTQFIAPELLQGTIISLSHKFFSRCGGEQNVPFIAIVSNLPSSTNSDNAIGHCTSTPGGAVYMLLDWWLQASDKERLILTVHELAHCALGKQHDENNWLMRKVIVSKEEAGKKSESDIWQAIGCGF